MAPIVIALVLLGAWQVAVTVDDVPPYIVPSPRGSPPARCEDRALARAIAVVTAGSVALAALALAVVAGRRRSRSSPRKAAGIEASLLPYAILLQVTPDGRHRARSSSSGSRTRTALVLCATVVAISIISNTSLGLRSVDPGLLDLFRMSRASRWQMLVRLRIPSALPYFFAGLRIASGLALIGAVVAEFVAGTGGQGAGLAYQILMAGIELNVPRLFAALVRHYRRRRLCCTP